MQEDLLTIQCAEWHEVMATYPFEMVVVAEMLTEIDALPCVEVALRAAG